MAKTEDRMSRVVAALLIALVASGCGARTEYVASNVEVERSGWDSLHVDVDFAERRVIGGSEQIAADSVVVTVLDASYEPIYTGDAGTIPVPDERLGDREQIMVEVCGLIQGRSICVQESLTASPKRLHVRQNITYPRSGDYEEGTFDLDFRAERQRFEGGGWETIEPPGVQGHLLAWVNDPEAKERGAIRIPFERPNGRFNLSRHANYRNFKYYLDSQLLDHQSADVTFEVHAGLGDAPVRLASTTKEIHRKTEDEREREVRYFAEQAAEMIIDELGSFLGARRAYAYVDDWEFNSIARTYEIELEVEWEGPVFDRGDYELEGLLEVGEDGTNARFRIASGNRRTIRKWRARTDGETLRLGDLEAYREDFAAALERER